MIIPVNRILDSVRDLCHNDLRLVVFLPVLIIVLVDTHFVLNVSHTERVELSRIEVIQGRMIVCDRQAEVCVVDGCAIGLEV